MNVGLPLESVQNTVVLLDDGNTVPFITRFRKDQTGALDEEQVRRIQEKVGKLRALAERKQTILKSIQAQGIMTPELLEQIRTATSSKRLEDLYLPYKPKKQTLATTARQRGLEPLAREVLDADPAAADLPARAASLMAPEQELRTASMMCWPECGTSLPSGSASGRKCGEDCGRSCSARPSSFAVVSTRPRGEKPRTVRNRPPIHRSKRCSRNPLPTPIRGTSNRGGPTSMRHRKRPCRNRSRRWPRTPFPEMICSRSSCPRLSCTSAGAQSAEAQSAEDIPPPGVVVSEALAAGATQQSPEVGSGGGVAGGGRGDRDRGDTAGCIDNRCPRIAHAAPAADVRGDAKSLGEETSRIVGSNFEEGEEAAAAGGGLQRLLRFPGIDFPHSSPPHAWPSIEVSVRGSCA